MLLELAIGDAYGAGFEYTNSQLIAQFNDLSRYVQHPRHSTRPGQYTDDTQMSIAIAEMMVSDAAWTPLNLASQFVEAFKRDPREGYASSFHAFLRKVGSGEQFLAQIIPTSDKSGAAMRAAPIGFYPTIGDVIEKCAAQAAITHNTSDGIQAAVAAALAAHYFIYDLGPKQELGQFLETHVPGERRWSQPYRGKVKSKGWMSVQAAVTAIMRNDRMSGLLKDCIAFAGDVDTVASIALACGSASREIEQDLPQHLIDALENKTYGRDYLVSLDAKLRAKFGGTASSDHES